MEAKLLDACVVLLGPQARRAGQALLRQLTVATVRGAFRRLALRTHPDRAKGSSDGGLFIEASRAYEVLMAFLLARKPLEEPLHARPEQRSQKQEPPRPRAQQRPPRQEHHAPRQEQRTPRPEQASRRPAGARKGRPRADRGREIFYHGPLPRRRLRLAEFLYYSGRISWQSLISALVWQRASRPKFGEIARQLRVITQVDMALVLCSRATHEPTGAAASRLRLLTIDDVRRILRIQRSRQRPIGRYFVEQESLPDDELSRLLHELFHHNARCRLWDMKNSSKNRVETEEATA